MRAHTNDVLFYKTLIFVNALLPLTLIFWDLAHGQAGVNPIESALRTFGVLALIFLLISLSITPMRKIFGWGTLIKYRRTLGLFAFFYACLHMLVYVVFDRSASVLSVAHDVINRPFIAVGMACFALLTPLALTSTDKIRQRMGAKRWLKLHQLSYPITIGAVVHFYMIVKSDVFYPALFGVILALLLGYRMYVRAKKNDSFPVKR